MENPNRILGLLAEGVIPSKIAEVCEIPIISVTEQIIKAIKERRVLRSQVFAILNKDLQDQITLYFPAWIRKPKMFSAVWIHSMLKNGDDDFDLDVEEVRLYLICLEKPFQDGELYEAICEVERTLHTKIKMILIEEYGSQETGWWRQGIPEKVRTSTVQARELDTEFTGDSAYSYTTLIHLKNIVDEKWAPIFERRFPSAIAKLNGKNYNHENQKNFDRELNRLNAIRNKVMHPVRGTLPTEEEFFFVKEMQTKLDPTKWRKK